MAPRPGIIPALPASLRFFNASSNILVGMSSDFPANIEVFDASYNAINAELPSIPQRMIHLNLEQNEVQGSLPALASAAATGRRRAAAMACRP